MIPLPLEEDLSPWPLPRSPLHTHTAPERYPVEALPAPLQAAAREVSRFVKTPHASPAIIGLAAAALAISKRAVIEERPGLTHFPALFFALVADTGERKSLPFKLMTRPLVAWIHEQRQGWNTEKQKIRAQTQVSEALISGLKKKAARPELTAAQREGYIQRIAQESAAIPPIPPQPSLFTTDATEERLFQKMHDHQGAYGVFSGEGRPIFDAIMGKYSGLNRTGDAIYLAGISGDTITRDRVGGDRGPEERTIHNPCLNVCIMIQPDKFLQAAIHPALRASGALARIWPVWLPSLVGKRLEREDEPGLDESKLAPFEERLGRILREPPATTPTRVVLSPQAVHGRRLWHNEIEGKIATGGCWEDIRDVGAKAVSSTVKLALVLHVLEDPERLRHPLSTLSMDTWQQAQCLGRYHLLEAARVRRQADGEGPAQALMRWGRWLLSRNARSITATDLCQFGPRPRPNHKGASELLEWMSDVDWVRQVKRDGRKTLYEVNPKLNTLFAAND